MEGRDKEAMELRGTLTYEFIFIFPLEFTQISQPAEVQLLKFTVLEKFPCGKC